MQPQKILVPIGPGEKDLKGVHYALSLARRLRASISILQEIPEPDCQDPLDSGLKEALRDLINDARQSGISISHYVVDSDFGTEIVELVRTHHIDLLIFGTDEAVSGRILYHVKPLVSSQIIQVREKNDIQHIQEGANRYGTCHDLKHVPRRTGGTGPGTGP